MIRPPKDVIEVAERHLCTGCGACAAIFPDSLAMVDTEEVARRPRLRSESSHARNDARRALGLCPGVGAVHRALYRKGRPDDVVDRDWGPVLEVWEGHASDPEIRFRGSSGGVTTALALFAVERAGFDGAIHTAAKDDDPRRNEAVVSRDRAELLRGSGSRYAPASPCERLDSLHEANGPMVFIGKPCDVTAAKTAAETDRTLTDKLGLTLAIFCAGTPSISASEHLLRKLKVPEAARLTYLRYRGEGWPGEMQAGWIDAEEREHHSRRLSYDEGWGEVLQAGRQWRCHLCVDHSGEFADIAIGDPWHEPPKDTTESGRSLIVVRSERGRRVLANAIEAGYVVATPRRRDVLYRAQPNLMTTRGAVWGRRLALRMLGLAAPSSPGAATRSSWLSALSNRQRLQSFVGTWKRVWRRRLWRPERPGLYLSASPHQTDAAKQS